MALRLKHGLTEVTRMPVEFDDSVSSAVRNALVEGDWVKIVSVGSERGVPSSAGGAAFKVVPVEAAGASASKNSYALISNPQQPDTTIPGVKVGVAAEKGYIGYTDRYDTANPSDYDPSSGDVPLVAVAITVGSATIYGLKPLSTVSGATAAMVVGYSLGIINNELAFRYLP
jgi:hypothetical protein